MNDDVQEPGDRLQDTVRFDVFPRLAQGLLDDCRQRLGLARPRTEGELAEVFEATIVLLYRLLFVLYAESRELLPVRVPAYFAASLQKIRLEIADKAGTRQSEAPARLQAAYSPAKTTIYRRLGRLFRAIGKGDTALNLPRLGGHLFSTPSRHSDRKEHSAVRYLKKHKISDRHLAMAIDRLSRDCDARTGLLELVDYRSFAVRQLGTSYEGLLECRLRLAEEDLTTRKARGREKYVPLSRAGTRRGAVVVPRNGMYLSNDHAERKASGSYYTPAPIVRHIVAHTVGPVLEQKLTDPRWRSGIRGELRPDGSSHGETSDGGLAARAFDMKVLDPSMGAGHFLVEVARFIAGQLQEFSSWLPTHPLRCAVEQARGNILQSMAAQGVTVDPARLTDDNLIRRLVLTYCIYGADINPMAVELAKASLWLDGEAVGSPLTFLDRHLRPGNSLLRATFRSAQAGFDCVVGNPPYEVLAEKERGVCAANAVDYDAADDMYRPARGGKQNLYKLFVCRGASLLRRGGRMGYIVPMALLGDEQSVGVRTMLLQTTSIAVVEAFPQKDDPGRRVFKDAKLSTCVLIAANQAGDEPFRVRVHPGKSLVPDSPSVTIRPSHVKWYDPQNLSIVACSQEDWELAVKMLSSGRLKRLGEFCTAYQGEVNETVSRKKGHLSFGPGEGQEVVRGACICRYAIRNASQGQPIFLHKDKYLAGKSPGAKAWHHLVRRVGLQESSPQNNFRRLIAAPIPQGAFCNHVINYFPEPECQYPLEMLLAILNSNLAEWYFRLGSTNAHVSHYQLDNLPAPPFQAGDSPAPERFVAALQTHRWDAAFAALEPLLDQPPFSASVTAAITHVVQAITAIEKRRGEIARTERSALAVEAQPYQDLLDRILYRLAGLTDDEAAGLERRLATML